MSKQSDIRIKQLATAINRLHNNIKVPGSFSAQVTAIDCLLNNDQTGMIKPLIELMVSSGTVPMKLETKNDTMNAVLLDWSENWLNTDLNIDIAPGLEALSEQYFRERWRSSFLGLKVIFEETDMGSFGKFTLPNTMFFVDGGSLKSKNEKGTVDGKEYFMKIGRKDDPFTGSGDSIVRVRKPYNLWHQDIVSPYLVGRGVLFNAMLKMAIVEKQAQLIEALIPYILKLSSGTDQLARQKMLASESQMQTLKEQIVEKFTGCNDDGEVQDMIATLRYDTDLEHIIPDLTKALDPNILKSVDKNILSGMGMVEVEQFGENRKDAALNPKVLIAEVTDAVKDWAELIKSVMNETLKRNKEAHPKLANNRISIIPGINKTFMSDAMRACIKNWSDRGLISIESAIEATTDFDINVEADRRKREDKLGWDELFFPRVIQNNGQSQEKTDNTPDDRQPNTPESEDFNLAETKEQLKKRKTKKKSYSKASEDVVKEILPLEAQAIWNESFEQALGITSNQEQSENIAWAKVKETYIKVQGKRVWDKK